MGKKYRRYTDEERATAVIFLEGAGYPDTPGALYRVSQKLKIPETTLSRWARAVSNPPPAKVVTEKKEDLIDLLKAEAYAILGEMGETRKDTDYRTLGTVLGIVVDKLQLLSGEPTERTESKVEHGISDATRADVLSTIRRIADTGSTD